MFLTLPESIEDDFSISLLTTNYEEYNFGKQPDGDKKFYDFSDNPFMGFYGYVDDDGAVQALGPLRYTCDGTESFFP